MYCREQSRTEERSGYQAVYIMTRTSGQSGTRLSGYRRNAGVNWRLFTTTTDQCECKNDGVRLEERNEQAQGSLAVGEKLK